MKMRKFLQMFVVRFLVQSLIIGFSWVFYKSFPFYKTGLFLNWQIFLDLFLSIWLGISVIYLSISVFFTKKGSIDLGDKLLILISFLKQIFHIQISLNHKRYKNLFLTFLIKFIFIPMMFVFLIDHLKVMLPYFRDLSTDIFIFLKNPFSYFYNAYFNLLLFLDTIVFFFAYSIESKWLGNRIREPQPHLMGWIAALICYPPFNGSTAQILPYSKMPNNQWLDSFWILRTFEILTLILYTIYFISTFNLGLNAGNLSRRKIITKGMYGLVRHPAYAAKITAWWIEHLPFLNFQNMFGLLGWTLIYIWRAYTEESHLRKDQSYLQYIQKVKCRFVPGLF